MGDRRRQRFYNHCRCVTRAEVLKYICPHVDVKEKLLEASIVLQVADLPQHRGKFPETVKLVHLGISSKTSPDSLDVHSVCHELITD